MNKSPEKAFTLVELMLAVMLTAIIILVAAAGSRSIFNIKNKIKSHDLALSQALDVLIKIDHDLTNIYREKHDGGYSFKLKVGGSVKSAFDRICFYSVGDSITDKSKSYIYEIEYGLLKAPPENKLYQLGRRSAIVDELENGNKAGEVMVIADSVKSLLFECWDGEKWSRELLQDGSLPIMIRVTLGLEDHIWATGKATLSKQISLIPIPSDIHEYENQTEQTN